MADLKFEIVQEFGELSTSKSGWHLELNLVQWGENQPKFDLRTWSPDHKKMGKGITLTHAELVNLNQLIENVLAPEANSNGVTLDTTEFADETGDRTVEEEETPGWGKLNDF